MIETAIRKNTEDFLDTHARAKITNRNIARLLSRLPHIPQPAQDDIKRAMWFLSDDLAALATNKNTDKHGDTHA